MSERISATIDESQQKERAVSKMKAVSLALTLALSTGLFLAGCNKAPSEKADATSSNRGSARAVHSGRKDAQESLLTKEEVGAILGQPVTSIEGKGTHLTYKTDVLLLETNIEVEEKRDVADAVQAMQGARTATGFLGGKPEVVPNLGDEALFGAMSFLYVRKGDVFFTITPPNFQMIAGQKAGEKLRQARGPEEMQKAMQELQQVEKTDPLQAGLQAGDAKQGALAVIGASSKKQGTEYETQTRAMAVALATKLLEKLGAS